MKTTEVTFSMKRTAGMYQNDTATVTIALEDGDSPHAALAKAQELCNEALTTGRNAALQNKLKRQMETEHGYTALARFLENSQRDCKPY